MAYHCPHCQRLVYDRRFSKCGYCGHELPASFAFSPEEQARQRAAEERHRAWVKAREQEERAREEARRLADSTCMHFPPAIF